MDTKYKYKFIGDLSSLSEKYSELNTDESKEYSAMIDELINAVTTPLPEPDKKQ